MIKHITLEEYNDYEILSRQIEDIREKLQAGSELEMQRKMELAEMVTQVLHEQKKQELYWERLQKKKLEDTLSNIGSIKGTSIKGSETGVV